MEDHNLCIMLWKHVTKPVSNERDNQLNNTQIVQNMHKGKELSLVESDNLKTLQILILFTLETVNKLPQSNFDQVTKNEQNTLSTAGDRYYHNSIDKGANLTTSS